MLTNFRNQIDQIDDQLIELLAKRFEVVKQVGIYKKETDTPSLQPGRWQEVLDKRTRKAEELSLNSEFVVEVWNRIHEHALELEKKIIFSS